MDLKAQRLAAEIELKSRIREANSRTVQRVLRGNLRGVLIQAHAGNTPSVTESRKIVAELARRSNNLNVVINKVHFKDDY